jgi:hypothetical protein
MPNRKTLKTRVVTERQAKVSWMRFLDLQQHGYRFVIKRRGKRVAALEPFPTTLSRALDGQKY